MAWPLSAASFHQYSACLRSLCGLPTKYRLPSWNWLSRSPRLAWLRRLASSTLFSLAAAVFWGGGALRLCSDWLAQPTSSITAQSSITSERWLGSGLIMRMAAPLKVALGVKSNLRRLNTRLQAYRQVAWCARAAGGARVGRG